MDRLVLSDAQWDPIFGRPDQRGSTAATTACLSKAFCGSCAPVRRGAICPKRFGEWNSVFRRFSRWSAKGVWLRMFEAA
jgi:putative transposase